MTDTFDTSVLTTAVSTIATNAQTGMNAVLPYALAILGLVIVWQVAVRVFKVLHK